MELACLDPNPVYSAQEKNCWREGRQGGREGGKKRAGRKEERSLRTRIISPPCEDLDLDLRADLDLEVDRDLERVRDRDLERL